MTTSPFRWRGLVENRYAQYTLEQRINLMNVLKQGKANVYVFPIRTWAASYCPQKEDEEIVRALVLAAGNNIELWVRMMPGDLRYCKHRQDRRKFIESADCFIRQGAQGIFLYAGDTHRGKVVKPDDGVAQALLCKELYETIDTRFRAFCGEEYWGAKIHHQEYWTPIQEALPSSVMVSWNGPRIWNKTIRSSDFPSLRWPLLFWDTFFTPSRKNPHRAYPAYQGRDGSLKSVVEGILLEFGSPQLGELASLRTAFEFLCRPGY